MSYHITNILEGPNDRIIRQVVPKKDARYSCAINNNGVQQVLLSSLFLDEAEINMNIPKISGGRIGMKAALFLVLASSQQHTILIFRIF